MVPVDKTGTVAYVGTKEVAMYCTECGQSVGVDRFDQLIHDWQQKDEHTPNVEESNGY